MQIDITSYHIFVRKVVRLKKFRRSQIYLPFSVSLWCGNLCILRTVLYAAVILAVTGVNNLWCRDSLDLKSCRIVLFN